MKNTIKLKKYVDIVEELIAHAAITPGNLVELRSDGKVQKHGTTAGPVLPMFALEDELQGKEIDDAYAENAPVQVWIPQRGEMVYALLKDDQNIAIGDFLVSDGAGALQKYDAEVDSIASETDISRQIIVGQATEAVDLSSSSGTYPTSEFRIKVRIA